MASYSVSLSAIVRLSGIRANDLVNELSMEPILTVNLSAILSKISAITSGRYNRLLAYLVLFSFLSRISFIFENFVATLIDLAMTKRLLENQNGRKSSTRYRLMQNMLQS